MDTNGICPADFSLLFSGVGFLVIATTFRTSVPFFSLKPLLRNPIVSDCHILGSPHPLSPWLWLELLLHMNNARVVLMLLLINLVGELWGTDF